MTLYDVIKKSVIEDLKRLDLFWFNEYARENHEVLNFLYSRGVIDDGDIEETMKVAVIGFSRRFYNSMKKLYFPDNYCPEYLAYALFVGEFSKEEIEKIEFDHGENAEKFIKVYGRVDLLKELREELLNPKPLLEIEEYDPHPACCD